MKQLAAKVPEEPGDVVWMFLAAVLLFRVSLKDKKQLLQHITVETTVVKSWMFLVLHLVSTNQKSISVVQTLFSKSSGKQVDVILIYRFHSNNTHICPHTHTCHTSLASSPGVGQFVISLKSLDCKLTKHRH